MEIHSLTLSLDGKTLRGTFTPHDPSAGSGEPGTQAFGQVDMALSQGVAVSDDGTVTDAPVVDTAALLDTARQSAEKIKAGQLTGAPLPPRPLMPRLQWALARATVDGYNRTPWQLPGAALRLRLDSGDADSLGAWLTGQQPRAVAAPEATRAASEDTEQARNAPWRQLLGQAGHALVADYMESCRRQGRFAAPFLVFTALRQGDGSHTLATPPVLMQPVTAAPLLRVDNVSLANCDLAMDLSIINAPCDLLLRALPDDTPVSAPIVPLTLDIFVTPPLAMTADKPGSLGLLRTSAAISTHSGLSAEQGVLNRPTELTAEGATMLALDCARLDSNALVTALAGCGSMVRVATVSSADLADNRWHRVEVEVLHESAKNLEDREGETLTPDYSLHDEVTGGYVQLIDGCAVVSDPVLTVPRPASPLESGQYDDRDTTPEARAATVTVTARHNGVMTRRSMECSDTVSAEAQSERRWLFVADRCAQTLEVRTERQGLRYRLRPHPLLNGAYWTAAHGQPEQLGDSMPSDALPEARTWSEPEALMVSADSDRALFPQSRRTRISSAGRVTALAAAVRSMSSGELGRFPYYAFTAAGVWAVSPDGRGGWTGVQPVSRLVCADPAQMALCGRGVVFMSKGALWMIEGSKERRLLTSAQLRELGAGVVEVLDEGPDHGAVWLVTAGGRALLLDTWRSAVTAAARRPGDTSQRLVLRPCDLGGHALRSVCLHGEAPGARISLQTYGREAASCRGLTLGGLEVRGEVRVQASIRPI